MCIFIRKLCQWKGNGIFLRGNTQKLRDNMGCNTTQCSKLGLSFDFWTKPNKSYCVQIFLVLLKMSCSWETLFLLKTMRISFCYKSPFHPCFCQIHVSITLFACFLSGDVWCLFSKLEITTLLRREKKSTSLLQKLSIKLSYVNFASIFCLL